MSELITGVIASIVTVFLVYLGRWVWERRCYRRWRCRYTVHTLDNTPISGEVVTIDYSRHRVMRATSEQNGRIAWRSHIVMDSSNPFVGDGVFAHRNREEYGVHKILISEEDDVIRVHFSKPE